LKVWGESGAQSTEAESDGEIVMGMSQQESETGASYIVQGQTVTMPAVVRDASSGTAVFLVPADAVRKLLPGEAFDVVEMAPGQAQAVVGFVDYRDNDLGDYNEVMIVFFVRPRADPAAAEGTFIYKLPVNQSFTCDAGCQIWGFPKSVEEIDIDYGEDRVICKLTMGGQHVFTLSLPRTSPADGDDNDMEMTTYTYLDGPAAVAFTQGGGTAVIPGGAGVELQLGAHPLADELRRLGLPAAPMLSTWTEHMHGTFGAPRKL
jgi:hypothetical protein